MTIKSVSCMCSDIKRRFIKDVEYTFQSQSAVPSGVLSAIISFATVVEILSLMTEFFL